MFDRFWSLACRYRSIYVAFLVIVLIMMALSALAYPFLEPSSASRAITQVNFVLLGFLATAVGFMYWRCSESEEPVETED